MTGTSSHSPRISICGKPVWTTKGTPRWRSRRCEQTGLKIPGCENPSTGRAQRRGYFQCNQWLILDDENYTSGETIL